MKERIISRLHLEQFIQDEVLFYSIVLFEKQVYYICVCAHFIYLFKESFTNLPIPILLEQIDRVEVYSDHASKFSIVTVPSDAAASTEGGIVDLNNNNKNKTPKQQQQQHLILEASNRTQLIKELQIHYKTNKILKKWQFDGQSTYDLKIVNKTLNSSSSSSSSSTTNNDGEGIIHDPFRTLKLDRSHIINPQSKVLKKFNELLLPTTTTTTKNSKAARVEKLFNGYWLIINDSLLVRKPIPSSFRGSGGSSRTMMSSGSSEYKSKPYYEVVYEKSKQSNNTTPQQLTLSDKLTIKIIPIRNSNAPRTNIRTFAQKMISNQMLNSCSDFEIVRDEEFDKERSIYKFDKTITEAHQIKSKYYYFPNVISNNATSSKKAKNLLTTSTSSSSASNSGNSLNYLEKLELLSLSDPNASIIPHYRIKHVVVCRRRFLPPYATHYQDIVFEYDYAAAEHQDDINNCQQQLEEEVLNLCVQSLNPLPQCFLYDQLTIRTKLESLSCDEDFYYWVNLKFGLKPELYPLKWGQEVSEETRVQSFVKSIHEIVDYLTNSVEHKVADPFAIEHDMVYNVDSPDTVKTPSIQHIIQWRSKVSFYLGHYIDSMCQQQEINFEKMIKTLLTLKQKGESSRGSIGSSSSSGGDKKVLQYKRTLILLLEYFLHLRIVNREYDFEKTLDEKIEEIEQKTDEMHYSYFDMNQMNLAVQNQMNSTTTASASSSASMTNPGGLTQFNDDVLYDETVEKHVQQLKNNQLSKQLQLIMYRQMLIGGGNNHLENSGSASSMASNHTSRTVCNMNANVFLKFMKLNYFIGVLGMSPLSFVKLLSNAIHISSMYHYETIYEICYEISQWLNKCNSTNSQQTSSSATTNNNNGSDQDTDSTCSTTDVPEETTESSRNVLLQIRDTLCSYTPFLHSLCSLLQYDDDGLLAIVANILEKLTYFSENVRKWFTSNDYLQFLVDHIEAFNSRTQPNLASSFLRILRNCCNTADKRSVITKDGEIVPLVVRHILPNILASLVAESISLSQHVANHQDDEIPMSNLKLPFESPHREDLLKSALDALLIIVQSSSDNEIGSEDEDELMSELIVNETSIHTLIELLGHVVRRMMSQQNTNQPVKIPSYFTTLLSILLSLSAHEYFRGVAISIVLSTSSGSVIRGLSSRGMANSHLTLITLLVQIVNITQPLIHNNTNNNSGMNGSSSHTTTTRVRRDAMTVCHNSSNGGSSTPTTPNHHHHHHLQHHHHGRSGSNTSNSSPTTPSQSPLVNSNENLPQIRLILTLVLSTLLMLSSNSKALVEMKENMLELLIKEVEEKASLLILPNEMESLSENNNTTGATNGSSGSGTPSLVNTNQNSHNLTVINSVLSHLQNRLKNGGGASTGGFGGASQRSQTLPNSPSNSMNSVLRRKLQ